MRVDLRVRPPAVGVAGFVCLAAYVFPYFYLQGLWWRYLPSTVVILGVGGLVAGADAMKTLGLSMNRRDVLQSFALFGAALLAARYVLTDFVGTFLMVDRELMTSWQVHQFFQVFNDELVMRAALLTVLIRLMRHRVAAIVLLAGVFALLHYVFYGVDGMVIQPATLLSLFSFGVIGNTLFVRFGHIGYSLALHYAWNFYRFNTRYYLDGWRLREGDSFNYIEGNTWVVAVSVALMVGVLGAYVMWARRSSPAGAS